MRMRGKLPISSMFSILRLTSVDSKDDIDIEIEADSLRRSLVKEMNTQAAAKPSFEEKLRTSFGLSMTLGEKLGSRAQQTDAESHEYEAYKPLSRKKDVPRPSPYQHGEMLPTDWMHEMHPDTIRDDGPSALNYDDRRTDAEAEEATMGRRKVSFSLVKGQKKSH